MFHPSRKQTALGRLVDQGAHDGRVMVLPRKLAAGVTFSRLSGPDMHRAWSILAAMRPVFGQEYPFYALTGAVLDNSQREVRSLPAAFNTIMERCEIQAPDYPELDGKPLFDEMGYTPGAGNPSEIRRSGTLGIRLAPGMMQLIGGGNVEIPLRWWWTLRSRLAVLLAVKASGKIEPPTPSVADPVWPLEIDEDLAHVLAPDFARGLSIFAAKPLARALTELNNETLWRPFRFTVEHEKTGKKLSKLTVIAETKKVQREPQWNVVANERTQRRRAEREARNS